MILKETMLFYTNQTSIHYILHLYLVIKNDDDESKIKYECPQAFRERKSCGAKKCICKLLQVCDPVTLYIFCFLHVYTFIY